MIKQNGWPGLPPGEIFDVFVDLGPDGPRPAATPERKRAKHTQEAWFCVPPSHAASRSNQGNLEAANDATSRRILGGRGRPGPGDGDLDF